MFLRTIKQAMISSLRLAGAAALCTALLLGACSKKTTDSTTATSADTTTATAAPAGEASTTAPDATASTAPDAAAATAAPEAATSATPGTTSTAASTTTSATTSSAANGSGGFVTLPIYPGAVAASDGSLSTSSSTGSVEMKWYTTKDDSKKVVDWYKAHLPASFENFAISANGKTTGTFTDEHKDGSGDQSVLVAVDSNTTDTRIQLTTKHGK